MLSGIYIKPKGYDSIYPLEEAPLEIRNKWLNDLDKTELIRTINILCEKLER